jgi:ABC-2 type transport system permease protein
VTMTRWSGVAAVVVRELRGRMRGRKAFVFLTFYLVVLGALIYLSLGGLNESGAFVGALEASSIGRGLFIGIVLVETIVVAALAPAYTASTISLEREKQTYDLLVVTPITSLSIAIGKLISGLAYLLILVLASIPLAALGFFFGGVEPAWFIPAYLVLFAGAFGLGAIGIFFSALFKRTQPASIATYLCLVAGTVGALFVTSFWPRIVDDERARPPELFFYFNPYFAQADVFCDLTLDYGFCSSVPGAQTQAFDGEIGFGGPQMPEVTGTGTGFWMRSVLVWLGLGGLMLVLASRFISPTHSWRPGESLRARRVPSPSEVDG